MSGNANLARTKRVMRQPDPLVDLFRRWLAADEKVRQVENTSNHPELGTPECKAQERRLARACARREGIEALITAARPRSVAGLCAQLEVAQAAMVEAAAIGEVHERTALTAMRTAGQALGYLLDLGMPA